MFKKIIFILLLLLNSMIAKTVTLNTNEEQMIKSVGIKVSEIASVTEGYVENSSIKSKILLGKITLDPTVKMNYLYDPWEESYAKDDNRKLTKIIIDNKPKYAILIITKDNVNVLVERKKGYELSAQYPFQIKIKSKNIIKVKDLKNTKFKSIIAIPDGSGMDTYLFWNGKKYVNFWIRDEDGDEG